MSTANPRPGGRVCVPLGKLFITSTAVAVLPGPDVALGLTRHSRGDWGEVSAQDVETNDEALQSGNRLLSTYRTQTGVRFWIITEADRSMTTVLLPEDY